MTANIYISGKIGTDTTLVDVIRQYKSFESPESVEVNIHSEGGSVEEGDAIYNYLNGLKAELPINTYTDKAYSIAAKIFSVGQERTVEDIDKALMIHFAWAKVEGNAEKLEVVAGALRELENEFAGFYSGFLSVDEDTVRSLLDNETFISGNDAVELGFATGTQVKAEAVAEFNIDNINYKKMTDKKQKSKGQRLLEAMAEFVGIELNSKPVEIKAELTLQDSNATDIVFPDLEADAIPKVGDAATMDGAAIPDGSYIMPSLDEATVVFIDGKVSEVIPKANETEANNEVPVEAEASFDELLQKVTEKVSKKIRTEIVAEYDSKLAEKDKQIEALKKLSGKEINAEHRENDDHKPKAISGQASVLLVRSKKNN